MDREINITVRRKQLFKRSALALLLLGGIAGVLTFGPAWIKPSLNRNRIRTAKSSDGEPPRFFVMKVLPGTSAEFEEKLVKRM